ncbi:MAG: SDR family NAD(P)-dependent oxidoreductase [Fastidiosipilaceae bacterium]|nr:SDR family NAD(P)-dependent oxidoreductase [Clostridiaceae bacterium]
MTDFQNIHREDKAVLITGASSGIGRAMALWYGRHQPHTTLILTARSLERLTQVKDDLLALGVENIELIPLDLAKKDGPEKLFAAVKSLNVRVTSLINNAGAGVVGLFEDNDPAVIRSVIELGVVSHTLLVRLFIPDLISTGGQILQVSSSGAFQPGPYTAVYYATKAYVQSFSEALAYELKGKGVGVSILCPGAVASDFSRRAGKADVKGALTPEQVADYALPRFLKKRRLIVPGLMNRWLIRGSKLLPPQFLAKIVAGIQSKLVKQNPSQEMEARKGIDEQS